jgi:hypothetical protein
MTQKLAGSLAAIMLQHTSAAAASTSHCSTSPLQHISLVATRPLRIATKVLIYAHQQHKGPPHRCINQLQSMAQLLLPAHTGASPSLLLQILHHFCFQSLRNLEARLTA